MELRAVLLVAFVWASVLFVSGCASWPERDDAAPIIRPDVEFIADPVPRSEPKSKYGNKPSYVVLGKRYYTLDSAHGFVERGIASWYGQKFHGRRTSNGETYDMYAMTAAHKGLPLPAYVKVTNLNNGRAVVLRVNDRGPFHEGRVIDVSYTAALKLDMLRDGTAPVEVRALQGGAPVRATKAGPVAIFVQAGAFSEELNARRLYERLEQRFSEPVRTDIVQVGGQTLHRVRIGPMTTVKAADEALADLGRLGVTDARLVVD
jgi:rare lipoprotein A